MSNGWDPPPPGGGWGTPPPGAPTPPPFGPPPPAPGEAPLAHIPFTPEDQKNLKQMALFARIAGAGAIASLMIQGIAELVAAVRTGGDAHIFRNGIGFVIAVILAAALWQCAKAIDQMLDTDG